MIKFIIGGINFEKIGYDFSSCFDHGMPIGSCGPGRHGKHNR
ncbi:MAG: hypothetical protein H6Q64_1633 [Firmicutes bacterium]|nr:hypothetical protein [Bacillota bacterium]